MCFTKLWKFCWNKNSFRKNFNFLQKHVIVDYLNLNYHQELMKS